MGGMEKGDDGQYNSEARREAAVKQGRKSVTPKARGDVDEVPKLKAALRKYEVTVCKLMNKLKTEQDTYRTAVQDLQLTNENLRDELTSIQETYYQMSSQRNVEQEMVQKLRGDNSGLVEKNVQLEEDLAKMVENIQHTSSVLEEMRQKMSERDGEMTSLSTEKKYLMQQLEDMRRMSRSFESFGPMDGRRASCGESCHEGMVGWLFGQGRGATTRMFVFGFLLCLALGYFFQNLRPAQAGSLAECDYEREEMFFEKE